MFLKRGKPDFFKKKKSSFFFFSQIYFLRAGLVFFFPNLLGIGLSPQLFFFCPSIFKQKFFFCSFSKKKGGGALRGKFFPQIWDTKKFFCGCPAKKKSIVFNGFPAFCGNLQIFWRIGRGGGDF